MRTKIFSALVLLATMLVSSVLFQAHVARASADTDIVNAQYHFDDTIVDPCSGEPIALSETVHFVIRTTVDASGGLHYDVQKNAEGGARGLVSGRLYRYIEEGGGGLNSGTQGQSEFTSVSTFMIVSQGNSPDYVGTSTYHLTFTPDGTLTAFVQRSFVGCQ